MEKQIKKITSVIKEHIINNKKEYIIITLIFIIGIFLGVLFNNNIQENQKNEIGTYINTFIDKVENIEQVNYIELLKTSIMQNIFLAVTVWFFGNWNSNCIWNCII